MSDRLPLTPAITELINAGAVFYVSHSGGKDSQAMYALLTQVVPHDQLVVVHADLGDVEWAGAQDHIRATTAHPLQVVRAGKTLLEMVERRFKARPDVPSWPSSGTRQCTSDLKRGPIYKFIRGDMAARGATVAVNCMGLRAEESAARAKKIPFAINALLSKAGRTVYDWMPIFELSSTEVFDAIRAAGQEPFWIYGAGNDRMSCVFCILGSERDLRNGFRHRRELFFRYLELERRTGWSMFHKRSLADRVGLIPVVQLDAAA